MDKKKRMLFSIISLTFSSVFCQKPEFLDSLKQQLQNETNDSLKVEILNELSWQLRKKNRDQALSYAYHAKNLAEQKRMFLVSANSKYNDESVDT